MYWLPVLVLGSLSLGVNADAQCAGKSDGVPCDTGTNTQDDACFSGVCIGFCYPPFVKNPSGICVSACSPLVASTTINVVTPGSPASACPVAAGSTCTLSCIPPAVRLSGNLTRTCSNNGQWSGSPLVCNILNPCLTNPCVGMSVCVQNVINPTQYTCVCNNEATGTPGPNGGGCTVPQFTTSSGDIEVVVPDTGDILFTIGTTTTPLSSINQQIAVVSAVGGTIDAKISTAAKSLSVGYNAFITNQQSAAQVSLTALVATLAANTSRTPSALISPLVQSLTSTVNGTASQYSYESLSTAVFGAAVQENSLSVSIALAIAATKSTANIPLQIVSINDAQYSNVFGSYSLTTAGYSTSYSRQTSSMQFILVQQSANVASQSAAVSSQISVLTAASTTVRTQSTTVYANLSTLALASSIVASQSATASAQVAVVYGYSSGIAAQSTTVAAQSTATLNSIITLGNTISLYSSLFLSIKSCANSQTVYYDTLGECVYLALSMVSIGNSTCNTTNVGALRMNGVIPTVCSGSSWVAVGRYPTGSSYNNPASSCASLVAVGDYTTLQWYWIKLSSGSIIRQLCNGTVNLGSDGSSLERVALSCWTISTYFGISTGFAYVDANLNKTTAQYVYCSLGVNYGGNGLTNATSSASCSTLLFWGQQSGYFWINNTYTVCFMQTLFSCQAAYNLVPGIPSGVYNIQVFGVSYPTWCQFDSTGQAWTLIMKIDGTQSTFAYNSSYWNSSATLNPTTGVVGGLADNVQYKSGLYNVLMFTQIRIGLRSGDVTATPNWFSFPFVYQSLYQLIAPGTFTDTSAYTSRQSWFSLSNATALQQYTCAQGFNVSPTNSTMSVRLGILGSSATTCTAAPLTINSRIGFGGTGASCALGDTQTVGAQCSCSCYNVDSSSAVADAAVPEFGFVLVA